MTNTSNPIVLNPTARDLNKAVKDLAARPIKDGPLEVLSSIQNVLEVITEDIDSDLSDRETTYNPAELNWLLRRLLAFANVADLDLTGEGICNACGTEAFEVTDEGEPNCHNADCLNCDY